jgi:hypothetical protein
MIFKIPPHVADGLEHTRAIWLLQGDPEVVATSFDQLVEMGLVGARR